MLLKFIGEYTGKRTSISYPPYTFEGREPVEVDETTDMGARLARNVEFERVYKKAPQLDHDGDGKPGGAKRPKKDEGQ